MDPPDHTRLRVLVATAFTPRAIGGWRRHVQAICDEHIAALVERGEADLIRDLAYPLPADVIGAILGAPVTILPAAPGRA